MVKKLFLTITTVFFLCSICQAENPLIETFEHGSIDWQRCIITAAGSSSGILEGRPVRKKALGRRMALAYGHRHLAKIIGSIRLDGKKCVYDLAKEDNSIRERIGNAIRASKILNEIDYPDGTWDIVLELPIYGNQSLVREILPSIQKNPPVQEQIAAGDEGSATGLIINTKGINIKPCLNPKIYDELGEIIYGSIDSIDADFVSLKGAVEYYPSLDAAKKSNRAGPNPIVVNGMQFEKNNSADIMLKNTDAAEIRISDEKGMFLENYKVIIVI